MAQPPEAPQADAWTLIAFSGHRHLADEPIVRTAIEAAVDAFVKLGHVSGISSAALGSDTIFAEVLHDRKIPFRLVLPFPIERFELDFAKDPGTWPRAAALFDKAVGVEVVDNRVELAKDPEPLENGATSDQVAYMDTAIRTIEEADVLIAVWDGKPANGFGGTGDAVTYARSIGLPLILINPITGVATREQVHVDAPPPKKPDACTMSGARQTLKAWLEEADDAATKHGPWTRWLIRRGLQLHLAASTLGLFGLIFNVQGTKHWMLLGVELILLGIAIGMLMVRERIHPRWLLLRTRAELCRAADAVWDVRGGARCELDAVPMPEDARQLSRDLALLKQLDRAAPPPFEIVRDAYDHDRVFNQISHYTKKAREAATDMTIRTYLARFASVLAIASTGVLFVSALTSPVGEHLHHWLQLFGTAMPLATTAIGVSLISNESTRRVARYAEMEHTLRRLRRRVRASTTWWSLARAVLHVEAVLRVELLEWRSFVRSTRDLH